MTHPLAGKRIVATRAEEQTQQLVAMLRDAGAIPIVFPTIRIAPLEDYRAVDAALQRLHGYDWVIFTSVNGVRAAFERLAALGMPPTALSSCHVAAIGPATEALLRSHGVETSLRPDEYVAEAIVADLVARGTPAGTRFLLLRADIARTALRDALIPHGAVVDELPIYRTALGRPDAAGYAEVRAGVDAITFTSSSTVRNFFALLGDDAAAVAGGARIACIGPITARTAREYGLRVDVVAAEYTVAGLMAALTEAFMSHREMAAGVDAPMTT